MKSGSPASRPASARCRSAYCTGRVVAPWMAEPDRVMPIASALSLRVRNYAITSMPTLYEQPGIAQGRSQAFFDLRCLGPRNALQVQHRTGEQLDTPAQHTACGAYPCLVLIEALGGGKAGHTDVDAIGFRAAVAVVEQHQVDIGRAPAPRGKALRHFIGRRQPVDVAHGQPIRNRLGGPVPQLLQRWLDIGCKLAAHPQFMDAMGASDAVT